MRGNGSSNECIVLKVGLQIQLFLFPVEASLWDSLRVSSHRSIYLKPFYQIKCQLLSCSEPVERRITLLCWILHVLFVCLGASSLSKMLSACESLKKPKWHLLNHSHQSVENNFLIQYCSYHLFLTKDTSLCSLKKCKSCWQPYFCLSWNNFSPHRSLCGILNWEWRNVFLFIKMCCSGKF